MADSAVRCTALDTEGLGCGGKQKQKTTPIITHYYFLSIALYLRGLDAITALILVLKG